MLNFINQFEQAFYYSPIGMAILSLEGKWLKVNPALSRITGYTEEELLSLSFQEITYPEDIEEDFYHIQQLIDGKKESYEMEKRYIHKNGDIVWGLLSVFVVREGNRALYLISQVQDITVRKQLEFNLVESEERFRNLLTYSPDPILVHDGETILYANQSAANLVDTTLKEMTGASIEDYIDPMNMDRAKILSQKVLIENTPFYDFDLRIRSENGEIIDAVLSAIPINYVGKKAIMVSCRDITVRKKMEQALKESEERYRHLIDNVPLGILIHENCIIQYVNTTGLSIIGAKRLNDIVGEHINKIIHPDYQTIVNRRIERIKEGKSTPAFYEKFIRFDGKEIDVEVKGLPIQMNGKLFVQVVFWDITEKKKEEDLIRYRAYHDTLTDLPNRLKFQLDLEEEINKDTMFTIMYLDLHGLKPVNDSYGHQAGDMVLIKVTARLTGILNSEGLVYRLGGDEFAVVLPGVKNEEEIKQITNKIDEIMKQPIYISNTIVQVTTSIGVVFSPEHGRNMETLIRHADMAMYHAKKTNTLYKIYDR